MRVLLYSFLCLLPFLSSCQLKEDLFGEKPMEEVVLDDIGLLDLEVTAEKEPDAPDVVVKGTDDMVLNPDSFAVVILDSIGQEVKAFDSFAQMKAEGELLLEAGTYTVQAFLGNNPAAGFDVPYYAGDTTCVIANKEVSKMKLPCVLSNKKVQFVFTDEFKAQFNEDYYVVMDNGVGVLTLTNNELREAFLRNTGMLRFTLYTTTQDQKVHTYSCDLSKDTLLQAHNNLYITIGTIPSIPDQPNVPDEPEEPEIPEDPEEPEEPEEPTGSINPPTIQVDITLIEKDHIIEIPSNFVDSDKPVSPDGGNTGGDNTGGGTEETKKIDITGKIDGNDINFSTTQTITSSTKLVEIYLYLPTGLSKLKVKVGIPGVFGENKLDLDLLDSNDASLKQINEILASSGMGKLEAPAEGAKGNQVFKITPFLGLLRGVGGDSSFEVSMGDKNGETITKTLKLTVK